MQKYQFKVLYKYEASNKLFLGFCCCIFLETRKNLSRGVQVDMQLIRDNLQNKTSNYNKFKI